MPVYLFVVEDVNGETETVAVWLVAREDKVSISKMAQIFKNYNLRWIKTVHCHLILFLQSCVQPDGA